MGLFLEKSFKGGPGIIRRRRRSPRLNCGSDFLFDACSSFEEGALIACILLGDPPFNRLGTIEAAVGIEMDAVLAAVQGGATLGTQCVKAESRFPCRTCATHGAAKYSQETGHFRRSRSRGVPGALAGCMRRPFLAAVLVLVSGLAVFSCHIFCRRGPKRAPMVTGSAAVIKVPERTPT